MEKCYHLAKVLRWFYTGSNESATTDFIKQVYTLLYNGNHVFFDLFKAFDTEDMSIVEH